MQEASKLVQSLDFPMTIEMAKKGRELAAQGHDVISLSLGEPDFNTPDFIKEAAKKGIDENYSHYMPVPGFTDLREAISTKFRRDNNIDYNINQIVVSTGAKQSLANVMMSLLNPGDEVIIPAPYWVSYYEQAKLVGARPRVLNSSFESDFKITPEQLKEAMNEKSKLMVLSSPCNPSGAIYSEEEIRALAEVIATKKDFYVLSDEIYELINYGETPHFSFAAIPEIYDQVITVNGLSKGYAMTGWRIGYIGAAEWIAKACDKVQSQFTSGTSSISQRAAIAAVSADKSKVQYMIDTFAERRQLMFQKLNEIAGFKLRMPQAAFYAFVEVSDIFGKSNNGELISSSMDLCMYLLKEALVSSVPGEAFGLPGYIRFSYAAETQQLNEAAERMKVAIEKLN